VLEDRDVERPARKKDDLWGAIVRAVLDKRKALDDAMQQRLLDIAGDIGAIGELANDVMAPHHNAGEFRDREIETITLARGVTRDELMTFVLELADRRSPVPLAARLDQKGVRRVTIGRINLEQQPDAAAGIAAARRVYGTAVETAETVWQSAKSGDKPDPGAARKIIDSLAQRVSQDRTSLMALTAIKRYDNYTFTHLVNVSVIAMAQARSLNLEGPLLREFGFAALMHDISKVNTPLEVLNKPDKLTPEEFDI